MRKSFRYLALFLVVTLSCSLITSAAHAEGTVQSYYSPTTGQLYLTDTFDTLGRLLLKTYFGLNGTYLARYFYDTSTGHIYRADYYNTLGIFYLRIYYRTDGKFASKSYYNTTTGVLSYTEHYDTLGRFYLRVYCRADGKYSSKFYYDPVSGKLTAAEYYDVNGVRYLGMYYGADGKLTTALYYDTVTGRISRIDYYNAAGKVYARASYRADGTLSNLYYYDTTTGKVSRIDRYDLQGRLYVRAYYRADGKYSSISYYDPQSGKLYLVDQYDTLGRLYVRTSYGTDGKVATRSYYDVILGYLTRLDYYNTSGIIYYSIGYRSNGKYLNKQYYDAITGKRNKTEYFDSTGKWIYTDQYYTSGLMRSRTLAAADSNGYTGYSYRDENFSARGYGRVSGMSRADGRTEKVISWWANGNVKLTQVFEANGTFAKDVYYYESGKKMKETLPAADAKGYFAYSYADTAANTVKGAQKDGGAVTYYTDTGFLESETLSSPDGSGNIYYHHLNEAAGRVDKIVKGAPDTDGAIAFEFEYSGSTNTIIKKKSYAQHGGRTYTNVNIGITAPVGTSPYYIDITPDGLYAYITNYGNNTVSVIDLNTKLKVGVDISVGPHPGDIAISKDGAYAYYTSCSGNYIGIIDLATRQVLPTTIATGSFPWCMAMTPDGRYAYVTNVGSASVSVIDLQTRQKVGSDIAVGTNPYHIRITPDGKFAYVTNGGNNTVSVIDLATNQKLPVSIAVGTRPCHSAITPDGLFAYVVNNGSGTVSVIDLTTNTKLANDIAVGANPEGIEITADGKFAYVTNGGGDSVSVIDLATNTKLASDIAVGDFPKDLAISPSNQHAYIVNMLGGAVSMMEIFSPTDNVIDPKNPQFADLKVTYTYYSDSGLLASKTLAAADGSRNIYYHYVNENWQGRGYGRMDLAVRLLPDTDGAIAYGSQYYYGTDKIQRVNSYSTVNRTAPNAPVASGMLKAVEYFYDASWNITGDKTFWTSGVNAGKAYERQLVSGQWRTTRCIDRNADEVTTWVYGQAGVPVTYVVYYNKDTNSYSTAALSGSVVIKDFKSGSQIVHRYAYNFVASDPFATGLWTNRTEIDMDRFVGFSASATINPSTFVWYSSNIPSLEPAQKVTNYASGRIRSEYEVSTGTTYFYLDEAFYNVGTSTEHGRLMRELDPDGTYKIFEYNGATADILNSKKYTIAGKLIEERVASARPQEFIAMANLAWSNYGYDLGKSVKPPVGSHDGYSAQPDRLREKLSKWAGQYVRIFLFCDMRAGIEFSADGTPLRFYGTDTGGLYTQTVYNDMAELLEAAAELNIKLIPTLFDYRIADGLDDQYHGEHTDVITDTYKRNELLKIFRPFIQEFGLNSSIYAWDVMNEPEMSCEGRENEVALEGANGMKEFVKQFVQMIHEEADGAKVTVGSFEKFDMVKNWITPDANPDRDLDIFQYHYYDSMSQWHEFDYERIDHHVESLDELISLLGKPVIAGEMDPTYVESKLDTIANHGYAGCLFWDDVDNPQWDVDPEELREIRDWFFGIDYVYYEGSGRVKALSMPSLDGTGSVFTHYTDETKTTSGGRVFGKVDREVLAKVDAFGAKAYEYEYYSGTNIVKTLYAYHSADAGRSGEYTFSDPVFTAHYNSSGVLVSKDWYCTYYTDSWFKRAELLDGSDTWKNIYKYYLNDYGRLGGWGREYIEVRSVADSDGAKAFQYTYNGASWDRLKVWKYDGANYTSGTDPNNPIMGNFVVGYTYFADTLNRRSMTLAAPDQTYNVIYRYYNNEDWGGGKGREAIELKDFGTWHEAYQYVYFSGSWVRQYVNTYAELDRSNPDAPVLSGYKYTDVYDESGNYLQRIYTPMGAKSLLEYNKAGTVEPKGVSSAEVASKNDATAQNQSSFTGLSPVVDDPYKSAVTK